MNPYKVQSSFLNPYLEVMYNKEDKISDPIKTQKKRRKSKVTLFDRSSDSLALKLCQVWDNEQCLFFKASIHYKKEDEPNPDN